MVMALASFISRLARHFMQYASTVHLLPFDEPTTFTSSCQAALSCTEVRIATTHCPQTWNVTSKSKKKGALPTNGLGEPLKSIFNPFPGLLRGKYLAGDKKGAVGNHRLPRKRHKIRHNIPISDIVPIPKVKLPLYQVERFITLSDCPALSSEDRLPLY